ncbi:permease family protein [Mycobacterium intracellulare]|nr:permease family protein [Mycobacterium intracellulare]
MTDIASAAAVGAGGGAGLGAIRIGDEIAALEVMGIKSISFVATIRSFSLVSVQVVVLAAALAFYGVNPNFALTV